MKYRITGQNEEIIELQAENNEEGKLLYILDRVGKKMTGDIL